MRVEPLNRDNVTIKLVTISFKHNSTCNTLNDLKYIKLWNNL